MHVLIIEDDIDLGPALLGTLRQQGVSGVWVRRLQDAQALESEPFDAAPA
jgi:two-component system response regulator QseB